MKHRILIVLILLLYHFTSFSQQVNSSLFKPTLGTGSDYYFTRFGTETTFWGGLMWNNTSVTYGNGNDLTLFTYDNRDIVLQARLGNIILFPDLPSGNVGIGTPSTQAKLDIVSNASWQLKLENPNTGGGKWFFGASSNGWNVGGGKLLISTSDASTNAKFALDAQGNLGLGTASHNQKLHLFNNIGDTKQIIESADNSKVGVHIKHLNHASTIGFLNNSNLLKINNTGSFGDNHLVITENGKIGIGTHTPGEDQLAVNGSIKAQEVKVSMDDWPDYVFESSYSLPSLEEVESHIKEKGHLKDIPSAKEVEENGMNLGEMDAKLLQKIEELTLYMIEMKKENDEMKKEIILLKENNRKKESFSEKSNN